jgi:hypothetical protein
MVERAQAVLATWQWIEADAESAGAPALWTTRDAG